MGNIFKSLYSKAKNWPVLTCIILGLILALPGFLGIAIPERDCASRYIPMTKAFAQGDWVNAFHARFPPLTYLFSGVLAWLGCSAFKAMQLSSLFFWLAGLYPLSKLCQRLFSKENAWYACLIYLFCSKLLGLSFSGLRATTKSFSILLLGWGLVYVYQKRNSWKGYLITSLAAAGLFLTRGDSAIFAIFGLVTAIFLNIRHNRKFSIPFKSAITSALTLLLISPWVLFVYNTTGYPTTEFRLSSLTDKIVQKVGLQGLYNKNAKPGLPNKSKPAISDKKYKPISIGPSRITKPLKGITFTARTFKGLFHVFFIFACIAIIFRIKRKTWTAAESIILVFFLFHTLLSVLQVAIMYKMLYTDVRYLISATPLMFGWTVIGMELVWKQINRTFSKAQMVHVRRITLISFIIGGCLLYASGLSQLKKFYIKYPQKAKHINLASAELQKLSPPVKFSTSSPQPIDKYRINSKYSVACSQSRAAVLAGYRWQCILNLDSIEDINYYRSSDIKFLILKDSEQSLIKNNPFKAVYKSSGLIDNFTIYEIDKK